MRQQRIAACGLLVTLFFTMSAFGHMPGHSIPHMPTGYPVYTAATDGAWNNGATWVGGVVPAPNSNVVIPVGLKVTVTHQETNPANTYKWIDVNGTLRMSVAASTRLYVETIYVSTTGTFAIGSSVDPLPATLTAEVVFTSPGTDFDRVWDPEQTTRGLIAEGKVKVFGAPKTHVSPVLKSVLKDARTMTLVNNPSGWEPGDDIVLAGTYFRRGRPFQDEVRKIGSLTGYTEPTLEIDAGDAAFQYDHLRVKPQDRDAVNFHVANLTRNIIFRSQSTTNLYDRGHIMLTNADSQVQYAALVNLGRTNKAVPLDDFTVTGGTIVKTSTATMANRRGRYSLHVHKAGMGPSLTVAQTKVIGCVARNTPGWGFVNHGSNVDFSQNVAYDFTGAGYVTEDGDELGSFTDNVAIRGTGDGQYLDRKGRINFNNDTRPQPIADFAFMGDGFWFNGPAIRVNGAIASSLNGNGMIWHTTGAVDPASASVTYPYGRYTFFPTERIATVYGVSTLQPRTWTDPTETNRAVIADLPILECTNVEIYGAFIGFRLRFNNHDSNAWYGELPFRYDLQIVPAPGQVNNHSVPTRLTETINNVKVWNSEAGFLARYAGHADLIDVILANRLDFDEGNPNNDPSLIPIYATEIFFNVENMNFTGLVVDGWDVANFTSNVVSTGTAIVFNTPVYANYALTKEWDRQASPPAPCPNTSLIAPTFASGGTSTTLQWTPEAGSTDRQRYLARYRIAGSQHWSYANVTSHSATVATESGKNYVWQVIHGCEMRDTISRYTAQGNFTTP